MATKPSQGQVPAITVRDANEDVVTGANCNVTQGVAKLGS